MIFIIKRIWLLILCFVISIHHNTCLTSDETVTSGNSYSLMIKNISDIVPTRLFLPSHLMLSIYDSTNVGYCRQEIEVLWSDENIVTQSGIFNVTQNNHIMVVRSRNSGNICGCIRFGINQNDGHGQIYQLAVKSEMRGRGIGKFLMTEAEEFCVQGFRCKEMELIVRDNNLVARELYNKLGFVKIVI